MQGLLCQLECLKLSLVNALDGLGMIDEYHLLIHPLLLHNGKRLLHGEHRRDLKFLSADAR